MTVIEENELSQFSSNLAVDPELENFFVRLQKKTSNKHSGEKAANDYVNYWNDRNKLEGNEAAVAEREQNTQKLTNLYYDLATDFYEWGWGESFHFGRMFRGDPLKTSLSRHEDFLALKLGLKPGQECIDVGCGIGGPLREIARFTGANIIGLNNNAYQVGRARRINKRENIDSLCKVIKGSFNEMPFPEKIFDAAYAIEATCHATKLEDPYGEIFRVLKPGGLFAVYEWCTTDKYNENDLKQKAIIHGIEEGDGIAALRSTREAVQAMKNVGFEVLEYQDLADPESWLASAQKPWYDPFDSSYWDISKFRATTLGQTMTHTFVTVMETVGLAPAGTTKISGQLNHAAACLVKGGKDHLFTPMFFMLGKKPLTSEDNSSTRQRK
ncbi:hypothetical protein HK096_009188 [Nowakowskiella sp. JEL0078]|nr:hypothetical protein HK096_009188 [Nowakowskiella sp. JEL0078]